jgi:hypothetical protein
LTEKGAFSLIVPLLFALHTLVVTQVGRVLSLYTHLRRLKQRYLRKEKEMEHEAHPCA